MKKIQIISLFPEVFEPILSTSMLKKAKDNLALEVSYLNLREFGIGPRKNVDDTPYGGGDGMLLRVEPMLRAIEKAKKEVPDSKVILLTPRGKTYKQSDALKLARENFNLILVCPRYEGYDERILNWVDLCYSIGNYILTGGEIPAMVLVDSITRLLPNVLGGEKSVMIESFYEDDQTLEFPQYTRPREFLGLKVPEVLINGNHAQIDAWRNSHKNISH
ncbi:MAG: tRNA (guanosine(37)-N1)-methyltransferase TrmD [Patescibacteria group bacterium]|jgi:tRNA (guanine37-N1)-methyltransferase|nr:tRNA (guanosine(37)-N1)-methyltransferase TrmD [Patescibacteria group bacterium]